MAFDIYFWGWLILALLLFVAEIFTTAFVLAAFGVGALAAAGAALLGLELPMQLLAFVVVSVVSVLLTRRFADRISGTQPENVGVDRVLGKRAVVLRDIDPAAASGMVRVDREEWRAESVDGTAIAAGAVVEIIGVSGVRVVVRPVAGEPQ